MVDRLSDADRNRQAADQARIVREAAKRALRDAQRILVTAKSLSAIEARQGRKTK
jgi:hypothetical protein